MLFGGGGDQPVDKTVGIIEAVYDKMIGRLVK